MSTERLSTAGSTNKVAIALLTKNRVDLTRQSIEPLYQPDKFDLWGIDGSTDQQATQFLLDSPSLISARTHFNVRGGADAAIVYALTLLLEKEYTHIGLCENDVLLYSDWFGRTMDLFERGYSDGINVGAVSPRAYEDRVLIQRDGYAVCHNLGAGIVIFTREAVRLILDCYRSTWAPDNRHLFSMLLGIDIGPYWAFKGNQQWLTVDWGFDATLASSGLASLALTPSACEMIGQKPSLAEQGLKLVEKADKSHQGGEYEYFKNYKCRLAQLWHGKTTAFHPQRHLSDTGVWTIFPHQVLSLPNASYTGDWRLKWTQGFGPFSWVAYQGEPATLQMQVSGNVELLVSGGQRGASVRVEDMYSGYVCDPVLSPEGPLGQIMTLPIPGSTFREVRLTCAPGATFYALRTNTPQLTCHDFKFDHTSLPPAEW